MSTRNISLAVVLAVFYVSVIAVSLLAAMFLMRLTSYEQIPLLIHHTPLRRW